MLEAHPALQAAALGVRERWVLDVCEICFARMSEPGRLDARKPCARPFSRRQPRIAPCTTRLLRSSFSLCENLPNPTAWEAKEQTGSYHVKPISLSSPAPPHRLIFPGVVPTLQRS